MHRHLPLLLPQVNHAPAAAMTGWLVHAICPGISVLGRRLRNARPRRGRRRRALRGVELDSEEVEIHLQAGKQVVRLAVELG